MTTTIETNASEPVTVTRLAAYGLLAAVIATVLNVFVRIVAITVFGVPSGFGPIAVVPVTNTTLVGVIGATVVYSLLTRVSKQPTRDFLRVAMVVLILSFVPLIVPPAFLAAAPWSVLATLAVMHVTTAVVTVGLLSRAAATGVVAT